MNFPPCPNRETVDSEETFWQEVKLAQNPGFFMFTDNDYHGSISDYSATRKGEVFADRHFNLRIPTVVSRCRDLKVDQLLIFSDHGFHGSSDFEGALNPLGPHRTRVLWYETDFHTPFAHSDLALPISQLSVNFFSSTIGLPLPSSVEERHECDLDDVVRDRWNPAFVRFFRERGTSIRWEADYSEIPTTTKLILLDSLTESGSQQLNHPKSEVWSGSFSSDHRVSLVRPPLKVRAAYMVISATAALIC
jgi:hypothetical protein